MFRQVLVAFDGSPHADDALALAKRLRDPDAGALTLACVAPARHWLQPGHAARAEEQVTEEIALMLARARAHVPAGVTVRLRSPQSASPARGLTELAEREDADLVVVGSSRRGAAGRINLERTAGRLLQGGPCAVAVAPADAQTTGPFRHVGIAYDGSPEAESALAAGYRIAAACSAAVTLLYAADAADTVPDDDLERGRLRARLHAQERLDAAANRAPAGVNPRTVLLHGAPGRVIGEACDGIVDLMVTGSRSYGPIQRALMGSVSQELVEGATHPVLVLPREATATAVEATRATARPATASRRFSRFAAAGPVPRRFA